MAYQAIALRSYYVYILSNKHRTTFYIGVTNDLLRRLFEHREGRANSFSERYQLKALVYFEETDDVSVAIEREKQLKRWHRQWKINLIRSVNPTMEDLVAGWLDNGDSETSSLRKTDPETSSG